MTCALRLILHGTFSQLIMSCPFTVRYCVGLLQALLCLGRRVAVTVVPEVVSSKLRPEVCAQKTPAKALRCSISGQQ